MKKQLLLIAAVAILSLAFTWEGELNPKNFSSWKVIRLTASPNPKVHFAFLENPDASSPIKVVVLDVRTNDNIVLLYRYFKYGKPYMYILDADRGGYVRAGISPELNCFRCHKERRYI